MDEKEILSENTNVWKLLEDVSRNRHKKKSFRDRYLELAMSSFQSEEPEERSKGVDPTRIEEMAANLVVRTKIISEMHDDLRRSTEATVQTLKKNPSRPKREKNPGSEAVLFNESSILDGDGKQIALQLRALDFSERELSDYLASQIIELDIQLEREPNGESEVKGISLKIPAEDRSDPEHSNNFLSLFESTNRRFFIEIPDFEPSFGDEEFDSFHPEVAIQIQDFFQRVPEFQEVSQIPLLEELHSDSGELHSDAQSHFDPKEFDDIETSQEEDVEMMDVEGKENGQKDDDSEPMDVEQQPPEALPSQKLFLLDQISSPHCNIGNQNPTKSWRPKPPNQLLISETLLKGKLQITETKNKTGFVGPISTPFFGEIVKAGRKVPDVCFMNFLAFPSKSITDYCMTLMGDYSDVSFEGSSLNSPMNLESVSTNPFSIIGEGSSSVFREKLDEMDLKHNRGDSGEENHSALSLEDATEIEFLPEPSTLNMESPEIQCQAKGMGRVCRKGIFELAKEIFSLLVVEKTSLSALQQHFNTTNGKIVVAMVHLAHAINTKNQKMMDFIGPFFSVNCVLDLKQNSEKDIVLSLMETR